MSTQGHLVSDDQLRALIEQGNGLQVDSETHDQVSTVLRGLRGRYSFDVYGPDAVEPEDLPDEIAAILLGARYLYSISVEGTVESEILTPYGSLGDWRRQATGPCKINRRTTSGLGRSLVPLRSPRVLSVWPPLTWLGTACATMCRTTPRGSSSTSHNEYCPKLCRVDLGRRNRYKGSWTLTDPRVSSTHGSKAPALSGPLDLAPASREALMLAPARGFSAHFGT